MAVVDSNCSVDGCLSVVGPKGAKGFCPRHYRRYRATGDPLVSAQDLATRPRLCPDCGKEYKPANGLAQRCRPCHKVYMQECNRGWREANPDYHSEYNKRWREEHPDYYRLYNERYRAENAEAVRERYKRWQERNPRHNQEWAAKNPERAREIVRRRRARLRGVASFEVTERDIRRLLARHRSACATLGVCLLVIEVRARH